MVKVIEIDGQGRINLSRKALLGGGASSGNGEFTPRPRTPREPREPRDSAPAPAANAPGAPPTRRRRRPHGRHDD